MTAAEFLRAVEVRSAEATPGPWHITGESGHYGGLVSTTVPPAEWDNGYGGRLIAETVMPENRAFIAGARDDDPKMAAALRAVLAVCASNEAYTDWDNGREYLAIDVKHVIAAIEGILAPLPTAPCHRCKHQPGDHFEDGTDEAPTACAVVFGDWACSCAGYLVEAAA